MPAVRGRVGRKPLTEYQGWPKGIYPMSDGWVPPCYPKEEELIAYEERMNARKKATLVKRHLCMKEPQLQQLRKREFAQKSEYSMVAYGIAEGEYSGEGDDRSYFAIVFYEPSKKSKVERAFKSTGLELADYEQVVVDPDSKMEQEASGEVLEYFSFLHLWEFLGRRNLCTRTAREMSVNVSLVSMNIRWCQRGVQNMMILGVQLIPKAVSGSENAPFPLHFPAF
eukprot:symbB.v1.2.012671.t1/scaffold881.1/size155427/10